ncbi:DUF3558 family protein [Streptomyces halobius]|uniref:DUF3558 domain-containing protein n=1 Tax=Streptomyces halobius TaxID=2879846 RepID=A0ABY4MKC8_9ACTN|nr:DUF3558 family protein [Streptomyces halobius]UQA97169.1 DUF3558 domain-containing protein [Streptomyces halobius]
MTRWDEEQETWVPEPATDRPPTGDNPRPQRMLIVAVAAALLAGVAGAGIWALTREYGNGGPDRTGSPPGVGSTTTASGRPAEVTQPCRVAEDTLFQKWRLNQGRPSKQSSLGKACWWESSYTRYRTTFMLMFAASDPGIGPNADPVTIPGVPAASAAPSKGRNACMVAWPASFGKVIISATRPTSAPSRHMCALAADFARDLAPRLPR